LSIIDRNGRLVEELTDQIESQGLHQVGWNVGNLPSGTYICRIIVSGSKGTGTQTIKMQLVR